MQLRAIRDCPEDLKRPLTYRASLLICGYGSLTCGCDVYAISFSLIRQISHSSTVSNVDNCYHVPMSDAEIHIYPVQYIPSC